MWERSRCCWASAFLVSVVLDLVSSAVRSVAFAALAMASASVGEVFSSVFSVGSVSVLLSSCFSAELAADLSSVLSSV